MKCYWCDGELISSGDFDIDFDMHPFLSDEYSVRTILECSVCHSSVEVLKRKDAFD